MKLIGATNTTPARPRARFESLQERLKKSRPRPRGGNSLIEKHWSDSQSPRPRPRGGNNPIEKHWSDSKYPRPLSGNRALWS